MTLSMLNHRPITTMTGSAQAKSKALPIAYATKDAAKIPVMVQAGSSALSRAALSLRLSMVDIAVVKELHRATKQQLRRVTSGVRYTLICVVGRRDLRHQEDCSLSPITVIERAFELILCFYLEAGLKLVVPDDDPCSIY